MIIEIKGKVVANRLNAKGELVSDIEYLYTKGLLPERISVPGTLPLGAIFWLNIVPADQSSEKPITQGDIASTHILLRLRQILKVKEGESITATAERLMGQDCG